jgi:hypothetical protein
MLTVVNISFPPINPDMKDYLNQRYTIKNPDVFSEFKNTITSYWFGFLCADGWMDHYTCNRIVLNSRLRKKKS